PHHIFSCTPPSTPEIYTLSLHDALPISVNDTCDFSNLPQVQTLLLQGVAAPNGALSSSVVTPRTPAFCHISSPWSGGAAFGFNLDRKSTRLNSSHEWISYAVFCLKKQKQ